MYRRLFLYRGGRILPESYRKSTGQTIFRPTVGERADANQIKAIREEKEQIVALRKEFTQELQDIRKVKLDMLKELQDFKKEKENIHKDLS